MQHLTQKTLLLAAFLAGSSQLGVAQKCAYSSDGNAASGTTSTIPFGDGTATSHFIQFIVPQAKLGNAKRKILALGFAPATTQAREMTDFKIAIRHTKATTLSSDRLKNVSGLTSTMQFGKVTWTVTGNSWNRVPVSFPYDPANGGLLIEIYCSGAKASGSGDLGFRQATGVSALTSSGWGFQPPRIGKLVNTAPKVEICFDAHFFTVFDDSSCVGSNNKRPRLDLSGSSQLGKSIDVQLSNGPGNTGIAILIWGFRHIGSTGLDLTKAGAPGCFLRMRIDFVFGFATSSGAAKTTVPVPNDSRLIGIDPLGFQWFTFDQKANALQWVSSNWGFANFGS